VYLTEGNYSVENEQTLLFLVCTINSAVLIRNNTIEGLSLKHTHTFITPQPTGFNPVRGQIQCSSPLSQIHLDWLQMLRQSSRSYSILITQTNQNAKTL